MGRISSFWFQLCGIQPFVASRGTLASIAALLWNVASIILTIVLLVAIFRYRRSLFADPDSQAEGITFVLFIKSSVTIFVHVVILLEALLARLRYRALDEDFRKLDGPLRSLNLQVEHQLRAASLGYRNKLALYIASSGAAEFGILALVYGRSRLYRNVWLLTVPSLLVTRTKHLQHTYYIDQLTARFNVVREQLICFVYEKSTDVRTLRKRTVVPQRRKMCFLNATYLALWRAALALNRCYTFSQLANLLQNFVQCTCDLYCMYSLLYLNRVADIIVFLPSVAATFAALVIVLAACENCKSQVSQIGQLLHKRNGDETDLFDSLLEHLELLLQHAPVYFSLGGFFEMDYILLKEMAAAITTYMVIFIQFMPKDGSDAATTNNVTSTVSTVTIA